MKVGVVGVGGVGGYFGGLLAMSGNVDIHFLARGKHLQVIEEKGLTLVSYDKSTTIFVHATSEPQDIGYVDLILFCVKSYDTEYAARSMEPHGQSRYDNSYPTEWSGQRGKDCKVLRSFPDHGRHNIY
jgi:Ketopantoate reductase